MNNKLRSFAFALGLLMVQGCASRVHPTVANALNSAAFLMPGDGVSITRVGSQQFGPKMLWEESKVAIPAGRQNVAIAYTTSETYAPLFSGYSSTTYHTSRHRFNLDAKAGCTYKVKFDHDQELRVSAESSDANCANVHFAPDLR